MKEHLGITSHIGVMNQDIAKTKIINEGLGSTGLSGEVWFWGIYQHLPTGLRPGGFCRLKVAGGDLLEGPSTCLVLLFFPARTYCNFKCTCTQFIFHQALEYQADRNRHPMLDAGRWLMFRPSPPLSWPWDGRRGTSAPWDGTLPWQARWE